MRRTHFRAHRLSALVAAGALLGLACASRARHGGDPTHAALGTPALPAPIEVVRSSHRPSVFLLGRDGDPTGAVAVVIITDSQPRAAAALAGLLEHRLASGHPEGLEVWPHGLGFGLAVPAATAESGAAFVEAVSKALRNPVGASEADAARVRDRLTALRSLPARGSFTAAVQDCVGEPVRGAASGTPVGVEPQELERWRAKAASARTVAFGAVGGRVLLEAVARSVARGRPWPDGEPVSDPWPSTDVIGIEPASQGRSLTLALRVADGAAGIAAATRLGDPRGPLTERLAAFGSGFRLSAVSATTRARGGCLRLELAAAAGDPEPSLDRVAEVALLGIDEAELAMVTSDDRGFALEQRIVGAADPRDAALLAGWSAVTGAAATEPNRRIVAYSTPAAPISNENGTSSLDNPLSRAMAAAEQRRNRSHLDARHRVEHGQGELWALLASPCGTAGEGATTAGIRALALRALARAHSGAEGVAIEPWIAPDGVGLLAHASRQRTEESPTAQAQRIGSVLGRVFTTARLDGTMLTEERARLVGELGPGTRPDWWLLLESLAPGHPSWLEPRGTFAAVDGAGPQAANDERRLLLGEPLRLAVLANWSGDQVGTLRGAVERWLLPIADPGRRCPSISPTPAASATIDLAANLATDRAVAHLGFPLTASVAAARSEAEIVRWLLAGEGGWLESALAGLTASAQVGLLGSRHLSAIVITVDSTPGEQASAVAAVRDLLGRLARTPSDDARIARGLRRFAASATQGSVEPRRRVLRIWRGDAAKPPTAESVRRFLAAAFAANRLILVRTGAGSGPTSRKNGNPR
ncbi:MAG: hypothetical protein JW751_19590 [Polyangiaceae bacterium]|nr:hypothetical protein [Polyangiaceae bacterium]